MSVELDTVRVLVLSIFVLWTGNAINRRVPFLARFSIPVAVTGGMFCSVIVAVLGGVFDVKVVFDLTLRDELLLIFFSTVGLSAKFSFLKKGGRALVAMLILTVVFLVAQNLVGILVALAIGKPPGFGLIGGSVSLAGGHGTAITWGNLAAERGFKGVADLGLAFATFGLILGGIVGGPIGRALIKGRGLEPSSEDDDAPEVDPAAVQSRMFAVSSGGVIRSIFLLGICVAVGSELNNWLADDGFVVPGFLCSMGVGILLTNFLDARRIELDAQALDLLNDVSLQLFLAMSLMSMQLLQLAGAIGPIAAVLVGQLVLVVAFARLVVFRVCGRDYDAAVLAAGFSGLTLGATPVGVANMDAVTSRHGPSPKAFLILPLVGAFFLDVANATVIQMFLQLDFMGWK